VTGVSCVETDTAPELAVEAQRECGKASRRIVAGRKVDVQEGPFLCVSYMLSGRR